MCTFKKIYVVLSLSCSCLLVFCIMSFGIVSSFVKIQIPNRCPVTYCMLKWLWSICPADIPTSGELPTEPLLWAVSVWCNKQRQTISTKGSKQTKLCSEVTPHCFPIVMLYNNAPMEGLLDLNSPEQNREEHILWREKRLCTLLAQVEPRWSIVKGTAKWFDWLKWNATLINYYKSKTKF
jgi:hypothetical protein